MKRINVLLKNENVQATLVIFTVFLITALISVLAIYLD
jgi:hypothetical protein